MSWGELKSGKDRVLSQAARASAAEALAELVWNALDAEATTIDITVSTNEMGAATDVVISDNGHGIDPARVRELFLTEGDSWKKEKRFSDNIRRPLHGQLGRGRLLSYAIAERIEWSTTFVCDGVATRSVITGELARPHGFEIITEAGVVGDPGTTVTLSLADSQKAAQVADEGFELRIVERIAEALNALVDVTVTWRGTAIDASAAFRSREEIPLPAIEPDLLHGYAAPTLAIIEWKKVVGSKKVMLCDDAGASVTDYGPSGLPPVPFSWTAYLQWPGFRDAALMGVADLHVPEVQHQLLLKTVENQLAAYLARRLDAERGQIVQEWKDEGVYPYSGEPTSKLETAERDVFDVVAVLASQAIPAKGTDQKRFSLRLLKESLRAEPARLRPALAAVLKLTPQELDSLEGLLLRTELGAVIRSAHRVQDRIDFLTGLGSMLYADATTKVFREVDQLHPMVVREPWVFGDEWDYSLSEHGLTKVVRSAVEASGEAVLALDPVTLESGKRGRVDMLFHRHHKESGQTRHLVVELKRPGRLTMAHFSQVAEYAQAIVDHPEVKKSPHKWDFWLVGTDMDNTVEAQRDDASASAGLVKDYGSYRLFVVTWGELLDQLRHKFEWYREELQSVPTEESGLAYLQRVHAEYLPQGDQQETRGDPLQGGPSAAGS